MIARGSLVALFGPAATKRVAAAATRAISEGRWATVHLASAASDMLGPEQLERVLALRPPEGVDLVQGPASALAQHLRPLLEPLPGPRLLELLLDLWARVGDHHAGLAKGQAAAGEPEPPGAAQGSARASPTPTTTS